MPQKKHKDSAGESTRSLWLKTAQPKVYPIPDGDREADVAVLGGGITGVTCTLRLAQAGLKPVLYEAGGALCSGTTGNTTGKVTLQHGLLYAKLASLHGRETAARYAASQQEALHFLHDFAADREAELGLAECDAFLFAQTEKELHEVEKEAETAKALGIEAKFVPGGDFPPGSLGAAVFKRQMVIHPVRYVEALAATAVELGARIFCGARAMSLEDDADGVRVLFQGGTHLHAKQVVMATQYPFFDLPGLYFTRLFPRRAYGVAVRARHVWPDGAYISAGGPSRSIRTHVENGERLLIVAGENHTTARGDEDETRHFEALLAYADQLAGVQSVLARWSAQDYDTPDGIPYIGALTGHPSLYVATGYGKWGLSSGTLAGCLLADLIARALGAPSNTSGFGRWASFYAPRRADLTGLPKAAANTIGAVGELVASKFSTPDSLDGLSRGEGREIRFGEKRAGVFLDEGGVATVLSISCTHMTTTLRFNPAEKTWDCPAHGGRFSAVDGTALEGPPKRPLSILFHGPLRELRAQLAEPET